MSNKKENKNSKEKTNEKKGEISEEFKKIVTDLMNDLLKTFPEFSENIKDWWSNEKKNFARIFKHCQNEYPVYFFDILYKNKEAFISNNFQIVPNIKLKDLLLTPNISENTYDVIWKYLQLLLFSIINTIQDKNAFGDATKNLFTAISPETIQEKLEEVMNTFKDMFNVESDKEESNEESEKEKTTSEDNNFMPNLEEIQSHLNELMDGKIGQFAMEMADDWIREFNFESEGENINPNSLFEKLLKDPSKMMSLMQKVFNKFQDKINSGELTQEEVIKESKIMLDKLKGIKIPGMEKMMAMLSLLTQKKKNKANAAAAFSNFSQIQKSMEFEKIKEKLLASKNKLNSKKPEKYIPEPSPHPIMTDEELIKLFDMSSLPSSGTTKASTKAPKPPKKQKI